MNKVLIEYKGVILLFLVLAICIPAMNNRIKELNEQYEANQVSYYEK